MILTDFCMREWGLGFLLGWYRDEKWLHFTVGPFSLTWEFVRGPRGL